MGDRSNINIIERNTKGATYSGVNIYSHWSGTRIQLSTLTYLECIVKHHEKNKWASSEFYVDIACFLPSVIASAFADYPDANHYASGLYRMEPITKASHAKALMTEQDNEHEILTIDLTWSNADNSTGGIYLNDIKLGPINLETIEAARARITAGITERCPDVSWEQIEANRVDKELAGLVNHLDYLVQTTGQKRADILKELLEMEEEA